MRDKNAVVVGLISFAMILAIGALVLWKSGLALRVTGYELVGEFQSISGLLNGAEVRYRGYKVGKVSRITPGPETVSVYFWIQPDIQIPTGSSLRVVFDGLIGEKYVDIRPNFDSKEMIKAHAVLPGYASPGLADFVEIGAKNLEHTERMLAAFSETFTSQEVLDNLKGIVASIRELSEALDGADIGGILANLNATTAALKDITVKTNDGLITSQNIQKIHHTIENLESFSEGLKSIISEKKGARLIKTMTDIHLRSSLSVTHASAISDTSYDFHADISSGRNFIRAGLGDRNGGNKLYTLQSGRYFTPKFSTRIGLFYDKPGLGIDYKLFEFLTLSIEAFDIDRLQYDFATKIHLWSRFDGIVNLRKNPNTLDRYDTYYVGIGYSI